ncbi:hypothetical protein [Luteimonas sp. R10]|uniref:hypothetical protein n=1 Tax=Luteimonas sp. R10 TaxID=3108176 RepID=UPI0030904C87|nr:hypothetical protein U3649_11155 [Luteimonas sp. R10]
MAKARLRRYRITLGLNIQVVDNLGANGVFDGGVIKISSGITGNPDLTAAVLAHELYHFTYPVDFGSTTPSRTTYINTYLYNEGGAMYDQMSFIRGGQATFPGLGTVNMPAGSWAVYDQVQNGQLTHAQGTQQLGQIYGALTRSDGRTMEEFYGSHWDETYGGGG